MTDNDRDGYLRLVLMRHAPTGWNEAHRIQGRSDTDLSERGRSQASNSAIPALWREFDWYCSPLRRTRETARLCGISDCRVDERLIEMSWGDYEGRTVDELRQADGEALALNEAQGLDFRPPGGESPRDVQTRALNWVADVQATGHNSGAFTHKGVIRVLLAAAWGWNMLDSPPASIDWRRAQVLRITAGGDIEIDTLNVSLAAD